MEGNDLIVQEDGWELTGKKEVLKKLQELSPRAVETLDRVMTSGNPKEARQAAEGVLSRTGFPEQRPLEAPVQHNMLFLNDRTIEHMFSEKALGALSRLLRADYDEVLEEVVSARKMRQVFPAEEPV